MYYIFYIYLHNLFLKCFYDLISHRIEKVLSKQINEKNKVKDCFRKWLRELRVSHMHTGRLDKNSPPLSFISDLVQSRLSDKKNHQFPYTYIYIYVLTSSLYFCFVHRPSRLLLLILRNPILLYNFLYINSSIYE